MAARSTRFVSQGTALLLWAGLMGCSDDNTASNAPVGFGGNAGAGAAAGAGGVAGIASGGTGAGSPGGAGGAAGAPGNEFTRYSPTEVLSAITPSVVAEARRIREAGPSAEDNVFMKVGASGTVSQNFMYCFAGEAEPRFELELGEHAELLPSIEYFRAGNADGSTPFNRATLAAVVGRSAGWAIEGAPSPIAQELAALNPRYAFVNYGTNDMGLGQTYLSALFPFYDNMSELLDQLTEQGVISIISGLNPRGDSEAAARWVPTYDAVTRGLAEARQLPYLSLYLASKDLPNLGLLSDGIHGNAYASGGSQPCVFTGVGLDYNYNQRNLLSLQLLDRVKRGAVDGESALELPPPGYSGSGTAADPWLIDRLPFTHAASTLASTESQIDTYPGCGASQDESGPELFYRLDLSSETAVRFLLLDRAGVDVDLHLLSAPRGDACLERADRAIQTTLAAGNYTLSVDSFVQGGAAQSGEYLIVVLACEPSDPDC